MVLPLDGIRVLDFSSLLPGPFATAMLAAAGAEITKVERPEGDDAARVPPFVDGRSVLYDALNGRKTIVSLDLRAEAGRAEALRLAASSDVVLTQVRPGVMERLGLGYEAVRAVRPDVVYCAITGYGQTGPSAGRAGHDLNYLADSGVLAAVVGDPAVPPGFVADIGGGTLPAVVNILLALRRRDATGEGAFLDVSVADNVRAFVPHVTSAMAATGRFDPAETPFGGTSPRYRLYATRDGGHVVVGALEPKFWSRFVEVIGLSAGASTETGADLATAIERVIGARSTEDWRALFEGEDCCVSVIGGNAPSAVRGEALHLPLAPMLRR